MTERYIVQTTGWPKAKAKGWQYAGSARTKAGADMIFLDVGRRPGVAHIRIKDRYPMRPQR